MRSKRESGPFLNPYILPVVFGITLLLLMVAANYIFRLREQDHQRIVANLERMIELRNEEYESVLDRLHATRNLPPGKVDLKTEFEERKDKREKREAERVNGGPIPVPHRIGPYDSAMLAMEVTAKRGQTGN